MPWSIIPDFFKTLLLLQFKLDHSEFYTEETRHIHRAALITQQSLAAKLTLKYQIDFPAISMVYWMNIPQSTCKVL